MARLLIHILSLALFCSTFFAFALGGEINRDKPFSFSFESFEKNRSSSYPEIGFYGGAEISNSTVRISESGLVVYQNPIRFLGRNPGFSAYFSFSLSPINGGTLGFFLTLSSVKMDLLHGPPPSVILVTFILSIDQNYPNSSKNHLEIDVGGDIAIKRLDLSSKDLIFNSDKKLHAWIDYNGTSNKLEVKLGKSIDSKPDNPIISYPIDLSNILWREKMIVGFSSSSKNLTQNSTIYSWLFSTNHGSPYLMHSEPLDPNAISNPPNKNSPPGMRRSFNWRVMLAMIFAAACGGMVTFFILFIWFSFFTNRPINPVEYPVNPSDMVYEKIVLVGVKGVQNEKKLGVKEVN